MVQDDITRSKLIPALRRAIRAAVIFSGWSLIPTSVFFTTTIIAKKADSLIGEYCYIYSILSVPMFVPTLGPYGPFQFVPYEYYVLGIAVYMAVVGFFAGLFSFSRTAYLLYAVFAFSIVNIVSLYIGWFGYGLMIIYFWLQSFTFYGWVFWRTWQKITPT